MGELFSTGDVAKEIQITTMGVLQAVKRGELLPVTKTRGGMHLFRLEDVEQFKNKRQQRMAKRGL